MYQNQTDLNYDPPKLQPHSMEASLAQSTAPIEGLLELDDHYEHKLDEWKFAQWHVCLAMDTPYNGMVSTVDVEKSYQEHKKCLEGKGYAFGTYNTDRSYFEKLDRCLFQRTPVDHMGRAVFSEAKCMQGPPSCARVGVFRRPRPLLGTHRPPLLLCAPNLPTSQRIPRRYVQQDYEALL